MDNNSLDIDTIVEQVQKGNAHALNTLGVLYATGEKIPNDPHKAFECFMRASNEGSIEAIANLAACFMNGYGVEEDKVRAIELFEQAQLLGITDALSKCVDSNDFGDLLHLVKASGNASVQFVMAIKYFSASNKEKGVEYLNRAVDGNDPLALLYYARFYGQEDSKQAHLISDYFYNKALVVVERVAGKRAREIVLMEYLPIRNNVSKETSYLLAKFIKKCKHTGKNEKQYLMDFLSGRLFMKSIERFNPMFSDEKSSQNDFRGDQLEGLSETFSGGYNPHLYKTEADGSIIQDHIQGAFDISKAHEKILSLTAFEYSIDPPRFISVDEHMKEFGEYVVVITDVNEFLKRVQSAFDELCCTDEAKYDLAYKRVTYDTTFANENGEYDEFHKNYFYCWQKEFRIAIDFSEGKYSVDDLQNVTDFAKLTFSRKIETSNKALFLDDFIYLEIGNIEDICTVILAEDLFRGNLTISSLAENKVANFTKDFIYHPRDTFCKGCLFTGDFNGNPHLAISQQAFFTAYI